MVDFTFGQVEAVLAHMNRIAPDKRVAFTSRLKHLQKQGIRGDEQRPGRGKAGFYAFTDLMKMVLGVELVQTGFPPQMAAKLVTGSWGGLVYSIYSATHSEEEMDAWAEIPYGPTTRVWLWMLNPENLRDLTEDGLGQFDHMESIAAVPLQEVRRQIENGTEIGVLGESWRTLVLHGTRITQAAIEAIVDRFGYATVLDLRQDAQSSLLTSKQVTDLIYDVRGPANIDRDDHKQMVSTAMSAMKRPFERARLNPAPEVAKRQAKRAISWLKPPNLLRLVQEDFGGDAPADLRATTVLLRQGLIVPEIAGDKVDYILTAIGREAQSLARELELPPDAISKDRKSVQAEIDAEIESRLERLLKLDPDYPENEAREIAANGGAIISRVERDRRLARLRARAAIKEDSNVGPEA